MSTYYQVVARRQKSDGAETSLGYMSRKSLAELRNYLMRDDVLPMLRKVLGAPKSGGIEILKMDPAPLPHMVLMASVPSPKFTVWVGLRKVEKNPGELLVFGPNPDGARVLGKLHQIRYEHETEGLREHDFDGTEEIQLLRDGSVRIYSPSGEPLWDDL